MRTLLNGEKRYIAMDVSHRTGDAFTISGATYEIKNTAGTVIESGAASTDDTEVYILFDTTETYITVNNTYYVYFSVTITGLSKIIMGKVTVKVV